MRILSLPEDPLFCAVFFNKENNTYQVKERVIDPYEREGFQENWVLIAEDIETKYMAEDWLNDIRKDFNFKNN